MGAKIMAAELAGDLPNWIFTIGTSLVTGFGGFVIALLNRGPAMQQAVNAALTSLNEGYRQRTDDLMNEVKALRKEVIELRRALDEAHADREGFLRSATCEHAVLR